MFTRWCDALARLAGKPGIVLKEVSWTVARLIEITRARYDARLLMLDWPCNEFEVQEPGARLGDFTMLDEHTDIEEVR